MPAREPTRKLFIAIDPSPAAVEHLGAAVDALHVSLANAPGRSTRLTRRENWHITVAFLGDVRVSRVDVASSIMRGVATSVAPLALCVAGGGSFGNRRDPILWAGIGGSVDGLRRLARMLQRALRRARLPCDERPPRPHLTIARPGDRVPRAEVEADLSTLDQYVGPQWTTDALHLMESTMHQLPSGPIPIYTPLATAPLGA